MIGAITAGLFSAGVAASTNAYESIATLSGNGSGTTISFTSIPSTFKHLQLRGIIRESSGTGVDDTFFGLQFNGDTATNYSTHNLLGDGASASANAGATQSRILLGFATQNAALTNTMGAFVLDILDYQNTNKYKTSRSLGGDDLNGKGLISFVSGSWQSTSAINRIDIYSLTSRSISTASTIALYGIKG
jgi:hypothetical protein